MNAARADDFGKLILRLTLGIFMLMHGIAKLMGGIGSIERMMQGAGLPGYLAYGVYIGEILAPLMIVVGWYARLGAFILAINMAVAIALVHRVDLLTLGRSGGWALELQGFFLFTALALIFTGPGRFAVNRR